MRYHNDNANLLFLVLWAWLAMATKKDGISLSKTLMFIFILQIKYITDLFLEILPKYCKFVSFGYFGHEWLCPHKADNSSCGKVWCISVGKKPTYLFLVSWYIAFILQICNFGYFHYICWRPINRMVSTCKKLYTCRKHVYLHAKNNLIPLLFLKILHFKESYNLIG